ncbi:MAG: DUF6112 family protein [Acidimicrobiales bacterium]
MTGIWFFLSPRLMGGGVVSLSPSGSALPGAAELEKLANGLGWWALLAALIGLVLGAAAWALGSHTNNYQYSSSGRRAVLVSALAALVIGAAPEVINFLFGAGQAIH